MLKKAFVSGGLGACGPLTLSLFGLIDALNIVGAAIRIEDEHAVAATAIDHLGSIDEWLDHAVVGVLGEGRPAKRIRDLWVLAPDLSKATDRRIQPGRRCAAAADGVALAP